MIRDVHDKRPKRKSLTMGELENSGFKRTQLEKKHGELVELDHRDTVFIFEREKGRMYLRKYSRPMRLDSRNLGRNLT